jgi:hypothetical protein
LAKAFPTELARFCWESTVGILSDGKEHFANSHVFCWRKENAVSSTVVPFANRIAMVVGEGFANSVIVLLATNYTSRLCQQLVLAVGKATGQSCWQRNPIDKADMFCWEKSPALPIALSHVVGKAEK